MDAQINGSDRASELLISFMLPLLGWENYSISFPRVYGLEWMYLLFCVFGEVISPFGSIKFGD